MHKYVARVWLKIALASMIPLSVFCSLVYGIVWGHLGALGYAGGFIGFGIAVLTYYSAFGDGER